MPAKSLTNIARKSNIIGDFVRKCLLLCLENKASLRLKRFNKYIIGKKILDVGLGSGSMAKILSDKNYTMFNIDVSNTSLYPSIQPLIYNGEDIPYKAEYCDTALLISVLHHCTNPMKVLEETMRVAKRIIIIEDTFRNQFEKILVSARDSVGNFEFYKHQYYMTNEWITIFKKRRWKIIHKEEWSSLEYYGMYGRQTLFVLEPE